MNFVKNAFSRLLGNTPDGRSKSENPNGRHSNNSSDSQSKGGNSLEFYSANVSKQSSPVKGAAANGGAVFKFNRGNRFKQIPELTSLADARRRASQIRHSTERAPELGTTSKVSDLVKVNQSLQEESKTLENSTHSNESQTKQVNPDRKIRRFIKRKGSAITSVSDSKEFPKVKSTLSKSSILDEKLISGPPVLAKQDSLEKHLNNQDRELPGSSSSSKAGSLHAVDQMIARSEAYVQKNRQDLAKALKTIEKKDNDGNRKRVPTLPVSKSQELTSSQLSTPRSDRVNKGSASNELPDINRKAPQRKFRIQHLSRQQIKAELSIVEEKNSAMIEEKPSNALKKKLEKFELELKEADQKPEAWRRFEIKSEHVDQKASSFENEIEKVDILTRKNSNAMADLVAVREDLMHLYLKEDLKTHRNRRKLMKLNQ